MIPQSIRQYMPGYFDYTEYRVTVIYQDLDSLFAIPWVKKWAEMQGFYRFSHEIAGNSLMAEFENGAIWYVVGFLKNNKTDIPRWVPNLNKD